MTTAKLNPIEIFKPGRHTPKAGGSVAFSEAHLRQAAKVYDPALHRAPFVIGHPKTDDLAYGHAAALSYSEADRRLIAEPADVEPQFAEMVDSGRLLAVSASFYPPDHPANPAPGSYYLRHVGFLGAEPPAVKGLKRPTVAFSEDEEGVLEFSDWADGTVAQLFRSLRDWLIGKHGQEEADRALPSWSVQTLADEATREAARETESQPRAAGLDYAEGGDVPQLTPEQLQAQATQLAADRAALEQREAALQQRENASAHAARITEFSEFTSGLVTQGRLLPAHQASLVAVMAALPATQVVEFSEAGATVSKPALQVLQDFLKAQPVLVDFSERARDTSGGAAAQVDANDGVALAAAAVEFQEAESRAGRTVSLEAAVQHVAAKAKKEA